MIMMTPSHQKPENRRSESETETITGGMPWATLPPGPHWQSVTATVTVTAGTVAQAASIMILAE